MLLDTQNKSVHLSICCGKATAGIEKEFHDCGFDCFRSVPATFDDFLAAERTETDADAGLPTTLAPTRASGRERTKIVDATVLPAQRILIATAKLRRDGRAIFSIEGTPLQDQILTLDQLRRQLSGNGAFSENVKKFVGMLQTTGVAEIRQPKLMAKFFTLG